MVALVQMLASRLTLPESTLLALAGIGIGGAYVMLRNGAPAFATTFFAPLVDPSWPAEAYLWLFLPPLLFQAALSVDVRSMAPDAAPILMLAIVAVVVATQPPNRFTRLEIRALEDGSLCGHSPAINSLDVTE